MNWKKRFVSQKLNVKFTLVIILFMVIPIGILAGILFYNMEKNVVSENTGYMEYTMERNKDAVATKINSINMSTQFFLSDEPLLEMLKRTKDGKTFSAEEWYSFKNSDIVSLERLVNNNPLLYGVRVYASKPRKSQPITICRAYSDRKISKRDSSDSVKKRNRLRWASQLLSLSIEAYFVVHRSLLCFFLMITCSFCCFMML